MPHVVTVFRGEATTPADRALAQHAITRRVALKAHGFLLLPFAVVGTEAVAIVPERLARRFATDHRLLLVEPPFGFFDMVEAAWWHPSRAGDPGHRWLVGLLDEVAEELAVDDPSAPFRAVAPGMPAMADSGMSRSGPAS
jgi:DNA-binding transcriptional LysR family regulator